MFCARLVPMDTKYVIAGLSIIIGDNEGASSGSTFTSEAAYIAKSLNSHNFATVCLIDSIQLLADSS